MGLCVGGISLCIVTDIYLCLLEWDGMGWQGTYA